MAVHNACVAHSLDTVHHSMECACFAVTNDSPCIQICVVTSNRTTCPGKLSLPINPQNEFAVAVIKDSQIEGRTS